MEHTSLIKSEDLNNLNRHKLPYIMCSHTHTPTHTHTHTHTHAHTHTHTCTHTRTHTHTHTHTEIYSDCPYQFYSILLHYYPCWIFSFFSVNYLDINCYGFRGESINKSCHLPGKQSCSSQTDTGPEETLKNGPRRGDPGHSMDGGGLSKPSGNVT